jgi:hypothetical protein
VSMERAALKHAREWLAYSRSPAAAIDRARMLADQAARDQALGHYVGPNGERCGILRCRPECPHAKGGAA